MVEVVGYVGSALVVASLTMTSVVRLRFLSLCGSLIFFVYAGLIGSIPIALTNLLIASVNVWFLVKELRGKRDLGVVRVPASSPFLIDFLSKHSSQIANEQPEFSGDLSHDAFCLVLTREGLPAGAVVGELNGKVLDIDLDYVIGAYRDSRLGQWLYGEGASFLRKEGVHHVQADATDVRHQQYLERVGFERVGQSYARSL